MATPSNDRKEKTNFSSWFKWSGDCIKKFHLLIEVCSESLPLVHVSLEVFVKPNVRLIVVFYCNINFCLNVVDDFSCLVAKLLERLM